MSPRHADDPDPAPTVYAKTRELVSQAQCGDNSALNDLLTRYFPRVLRVVRMKRGPFLSQRLEDLDMVQEILIRVWRSLDQYNPRENASFLIWVTRIAENALRDLARRQGARKRHPKEGVVFSLQADHEEEGDETELHPIYESTPSRVLSSFESTRLVDEAVAALDQETHQLIVMRFYYDLPLKEMSYELDLNAEAVRSRIRRALTKLKPQLQKRGVEGAQHPIRVLRRSFGED